MASIRKRNGRWQVQVRRIGSASISRTFTKKPDAVAWATEREHSIEIADLRIPDRKQAHTLADLLVRYERETLPLKRAPEPERYVVQAILRHPLSRKPVRQITAEDFARYRDERLKTIKASTLRRQLNVLRHALRTASMEWGWSVPRLALSQVQIPPAVHFHVERVSDGIVAKLLAAADRQQNPCIAFSIRLALHTGMRRGELLALDWADVDLHRQRLLIRTSKNGRPRVIPLSPSAVSLLKGQNLKERRVIPITANCLRLGFERARAAASVGLRFHDLRHEAISRFFELGLTIPEVQLISGHRTLSQLSRYSHPDVKRLQNKLSSVLSPTEALSFTTDSP